MVDLTQTDRRIDPFVPNTADLSANFLLKEAIPRALYPKDWSTAMIEDYSSKGEDVKLLVQQINLLRQELCFSQLVIQDNQKRIQALENA